jgi:hypothetical protein
VIRDFFCDCVLGAVGAAAVWAPIIALFYWL